MKGLSHAWGVFPGRQGEGSLRPDVVMAPRTGKPESQGKLRDGGLKSPTLGKSLALVLTGLDCLSVRAHMDNGQHTRCARHGAGEGHRLDSGTALNRCAIAVLQPWIHRHQRDGVHAA